MAKALDLDYSLGTRAAITFENFFLGGGAMAGYNMAEIKALPYRLINKIIPNTLGGSADLTGSNLTKTSKMKTVLPGKSSGNYIHYGIREHAMGSIMNGISLHKGFIIN